MRAAVYHGVRDVRVEDVDEPDVGPGEVKLAVAYNGICGTDLHEVFDGPRAIPTTPHPLTGACAPVILGHEAAGVVVGVGEGVTGIGEGDLVAVEPILRCGACPWCVAGHYNLCERVAFHGLSTGGGGLCEYTTVPATMAHRVPAGVDPLAAAVVEPLAVAHHAVERSRVREGQVAVVHGAGPIGLGVLLTLRARGVPCIAFEPSAGRRAVAERFGATTLDPTAEGVDVGAEVRDRTAGRGADVSFDTAGGPATFASAVATTARHGTVHVVAAPPRPEPLPALRALLAGEIDVRTSYAYCGDFPAVIEQVAAGAYPLDGWVSTMPLTRIVEALELLRAGEAMKILIDPTA
jgi:(R,R)-butanediol dehydrogenase/meso-butanediol dehydrogenase/diacetyl reductase